MMALPNLIYQLPYDENKNAQEREPLIYKKKKGKSLYLIAISFYLFYTSLMFI